MPKMDYLNNNKANQIDDEVIVLLEEGLDESIKEAIIHELEALGMKEIRWYTPTMLLGNIHPIPYSIRNILGVRSFGPNRKAGVA